MNIKRDMKKYSEFYTNDGFRSTMVKYRRRKIMEILDSYKPKNVLEVGCGLQSLFDFYQDYDTFTIIEPSEDFIETVKKSENFNDRVKIVSGFIEDNIDNLKNQKYDFIVVSSLLHEVLNPEMLLKSIKNLMSKDTLIHINVPNSKGFHLLWAYKSGLIPNLGNLSERAKILQQHTTYDTDTLKEFVEKLGFVVVESGSYFVKPFNHAKMQECLDNGIIDEKLLDGLFKMTDYFPELGSEIFVNCKIRD